MTEAKPRMKGSTPNSPYEDTPTRMRIKPSRAKIAAKHREIRSCMIRRSKVVLWGVAWLGVPRLVCAVNPMRPNDTRKPCAGVKCFLCYADYSPCAARLVGLYDLAHGVSGIFYVNAITDLYGRGCVFVYEFHDVDLS